MWSPPRHRQRRASQLLMARSLMSKGAVRRVRRRTVMISTRSRWGGFTKARSMAASMPPCSGIHPAATRRCKGRMDFNRKRPLHPASAAKRHSERSAPGRGRPCGQGRACRGGRARPGNLRAGSARHGISPHADAGRQPGNIDRWPKGPAIGYPGQYGGVEREIRRQTRAAQDPVPGLMDMINSGRLRLNAANWQE